MRDRFAPRPGELRLSAKAQADATLSFVGTIRSDWRLDDCPKNLRRARERSGGNARLEILPPYRPALSGLAPGDGLVLLYWMSHAPRDLLRQHPRHRDAPAGTFALRSPARPNPIALAAVRCVALDIAAGVVGVDAIDAVDGTPLLDIKPWLPTVDIPPEAARD
ncbi:MAG: SAM-dependent methyltransferase [Rhodobacteraceae bacterium]|nr:SAM-dependent methyltransferase [Paracoccaceae bacterium]